MTSETSEPTYHVLLVGIDRYPPGYNSLRGCVNDIDAIEQLLLEPPGIGFPPGQIQITRLAASRPGHASTSRCQAETRAPTRANFLQALQTLAGSAVQPADRVLIYYSGHGYETRWPGSPVWHEALVPNNDQDVEFIFDIEINSLIEAVAKRTSDLTIVLDSCHSAGATRDLGGAPSQSAARFLHGPVPLILPPQPAQPGLASSAAQQKSASHLLQSLDASYLVVAACQPNETAGEGAPASQASHGVFTYSLLSLLGQKDAAQRTQLRWADVWPELLAKMAERNTLLGQQMQHPWLIGRSERKLFGGPWEKMDSGYQITRRQDGDYEVGAGSLMSVTAGAEIAVYGKEPRLFPPLGSPSDQPVGRLVVIQAGPSSAVARPPGEPFELPDGARGRLVKPGDSRRLRVRIQPADEKLAEQLRQSPLLAVTSTTNPDTDIEVIAQPGGGWIIGNDMEPVLAAVPAGEILALRAGLEHYYRYEAVLNMARGCSDPQLSNCLQVRILDCNNESAMKAMKPEILADPDLPEAARDDDRIYCLNTGFQFCIKVTNSSDECLNVTLLDCSSGGSAQYLSDAVLREKAAQVMWLDNRLGEPFWASPDEIPAGRHGTQARPFATDRVIAFGTTRLDADLKSMALDKTVQQVVEENLSGRRGLDRGVLPKPQPAAPTEWWTATLTPIRILR
jgi:hypothetical protein